MQQSEDLVSQREREVRQIAKSIVELSSIFKDLATLVIEQVPSLQLTFIQLSKCKIKSTLTDIQCKIEFYF